MINNPFKILKVLFSGCEFKLQPIAFHVVKSRDWRDELYCLIKPFNLNLCSTLERGGGKQTLHFQLSLGVRMEVPSLIIVINLPWTYENPHCNKEADIVTFVRIGLNITCLCLIFQFGFLFSCLYRHNVITWTDFICPPTT